ncbi:MAG TPA: MaoC family dehydratase [Solirubrobacteraceae bacterium]
MILSAGSELGPWTVDHVDPDKMKVFAEVLADPNPIHLDPQAVIDAGLGDRVINQGPASFGYVLNMLYEAAPHAAIRDLNVRLTANVFGGDRITVAGTIESVDEIEGERRASCRVWVDVEGGRRALQGTATLVLPVE